ncbi:MAG: hypothetical protein ACHQDE_06710 [Acidimicrobiia bacterium]
MTDGGTDRVLVVCSANQCRSALAGVLLVEQLRRLELDVVVDSAGMHAVAGLPATPPTVAAAAALGVDLSAHRSRPAPPSLIAAADLVLTMERAHVREVVVTDPQAFSRTFTLKELVRRGTEVGPREAGEPVPTWLGRVHEGRRAIDLLGGSDDDDIGDPTGSRLLDHRSTAREIDELLAQVIDLVWPEPA